MPLVPSFRHLRSTEVRKQTTPLLARHQVKQHLHHAPHFIPHHREKKGEHRTIRYIERQVTHIYPPKHIYIIFIGVDRYSCSVVHLLLCPTCTLHSTTGMHVQENHNTYRVQYSPGFRAPAGGLGTHTRRYWGTTLHSTVDSF